MDKQTLLEETEHRFMRACEEIAHLNTKKSDLVSRYYKAMMDNNQSVIPSLKYRITTVEEIRQLYDYYASCKAQTMADLRRELYGDAQISDNFSRLRI
jgi:hypothetical protein